MEDGIDFGDAKDVEDAFGDAGEAELSAGGAGFAVTADEDADAGAIDEGDIAQVEDDAGFVALDELFDGPFQLLGVAAKGKTSGDFENFDPGLECISVYFEGHDTSEDFITCS